MRPFYFGTNQRPLFGAYEPAASGRGARGAVLLCYPFGAEYMRSHRAFRELSHRLSEAGVHALRFDFYGCGDSSGDAADGRIDLWLEDVKLAYEELREASGIARPSILGLRLGASIAAIATSRGLNADKLLLWDPIVNGREFVAELAARHEALVKARPRPRGYVPDNPPSEVLGAPLPAELRAQLEALDLTTLPACAAQRVLLLGSHQPAHAAALQARFETLRVPVELAGAAALPVWLKRDDMDRTLVPLEILELFVTRLRERAA